MSSVQTEFFPMALDFVLYLSYMSKASITYRMVSSEIVKHKRK